MKRNIFFVAVLSAIISVAFAQKTQYTEFPDMPVDENTKLVTYRDVVQEVGSPEILYARALKWANKYYSNPTVVITKQDKKNCVVECVSNVGIKTLSKDGKTWVNAGFVYYTLTIEARQDRYRYTITDFHKRETARFPIEKWFDTSRPEWTAVRYDHLNQIDQAVRKLIESLEEGMEPEKVIVDEW